MKTLASQNGEIQLAPITEKDAKPLFSIVDSNRGIFRKWLPWVDETKSVEDIEKFVRSTIKQAKEGIGLVFAIRYQGVVVGVISFNHVHKNDRKATIGYWLNPACQGKGIMTEACRLLISYGFDALHLNRVEIGCAVENTKSCAIPERLGFTKEGVIRDSEWLYDHFVDHNFYGLLKRDWQNV